MAYCLKPAPHVTEIKLVDRAQARREMRARPKQPKGRKNARGNSEPHCRLETLPPEQPRDQTTYCHNACAADEACDSHHQPGCSCAPQRRLIEPQGQPQGKE